MELEYRRLDENGDYIFGQGKGNFFVNSVEAVAQAVKTRLDLIEGEWFLDVTEGTPYESQILGAGKTNTYDQAIQSRILGTPGVTRLLEYYSSINQITRKLSVNCKIDTVFGTTDIVKAF